MDYYGFLLLRSGFILTLAEISNWAILINCIDMTRSELYPNLGWDAIGLTVKLWGKGWEWKYPDLRECVKCATSINANMKCTTLNVLSIMILDWGILIGTTTWPCGILSFRILSSKLWWMGTQLSLSGLTWLISCLHARRKEPEHFQVDYVYVFNLCICF